MEKHLNHYLSVIEKKSNKDNLISTSRDNIYSFADEISEMLDKVNNAINEVKSRVFQNGTQFVESNNMDFSNYIINKEEHDFDVKYN